MSVYVVNMMDHTFMISPKHGQLLEPPPLKQQINCFITIGLNLPSHFMDVINVWTLRQYWYVIQQHMSRLIYWQLFKTKQFKN